MLNGNRSIPYLCRFELTLPAITIGIVAGVEVAGDADRLAKARSHSLHIFFFFFSSLSLFISFVGIRAATVSESN